ncbi:hypothetical protein ACODM8_21420 [Vibrio ostreicida]|uniref:hypothetical protein n=1 Tax=Vibrio ostreicida TaxID=526588 RepID=UPI003B5AF681
MTEPTIEHINQCLAQANFAAVAKINSYFQIWEVIDAILEDSNFSEETNFERIRVLLRAGILTEVNVLEYYNSDVEDMDLSYEHCPLVKILSPLERDGTLYLSGSGSFYEDLCYDIYLDYIKNIVLLGGRVDFDGMLRWVFNERSEFELFNYLVDNFKVKPTTINNVAAQTIDYLNSHKSCQKAESAFKKLIDMGININLAIEEDDWYSDYRSFLGVVFCYDPAMFEQYLLQKPSQQIIADLPWEFAIESGYFRDKQLQLVQKLIELGYPLPLDEIIELLEEEELDDYAKALAH